MYYKEIYYLVVDAVTFTYLIIQAMRSGTMDTDIYMQFLKDTNMKDIIPERWIILEICSWELYLIE